jgi:predicted ATP-grasp superfamily ATP-dependent carboligase
VRLTGIASDGDLIAGLGMREPSYRGPTGIVGVLHEAAIARGFTAVSLWAPASHYAAGVTNAKATLALVRGLETVAGVTVDAEDLELAAETYVEQVSRAVEGDPRLRGLVEQLEQAADQEAPDDPGPLPSGDELAREFERYLRRREDDPA